MSEKTTYRADDIVDETLSDWNALLQGIEEQTDPKELRLYRRLAEGRRHAYMAQWEMRVLLSFTARGLIESRGDHDIGELSDADVDLLRRFCRRMGFDMKDGSTS